MVESSFPDEEEEAFEESKETSGAPEDVKYAPHDTTRIGSPASLGTESSAGQRGETEDDIDVTERAFSPSDDTLSAIKDLGLKLQAVPDQKIIGRVAHYDIIRILGRGGMGSVFEAFDTKLYRPVAIKFMASSLAANEKSRSRFLREARVAASINHSNVVTIHAVDEYDGRPYLVMELVSGTTLHEHIKNRAPLPIPDALRIGRQIATGLRAAHEKAIVHRDVKPGNILLENGIQRVKIVDFGLALVIFERSDITSQGQTLGTPRYMAPEQIEDNRVDERADLFSFGCVLYSMCAGQPPFVGNSISVLQRILRDKHVPLRQLNAEAPRALSSLLDNLLCKDRSRRIQTAAEAEKILAEIIRAEDSSGTQMVPQKHAAKSQTVWLLAVGVVLLTTIAFWAVGKFQGNRETSNSFEAGQVHNLESASETLEPPNEASEQTPPRVHGPGPETAVVGPTGDFLSLKEAVAYVRPRDTIVVQGAIPDDDTLNLSDPKRHANLTVDWQHDSTMNLSESVSAAISIDSVPGVHIRGIKARAQNSHLISVRGDCSGLTIEDCHLEQAVQCRQAAVVFWTSAKGSVSAPITLRQCELVFFELGCAFIGSSESPIEWILMENNLIRGLQPKWGTGLVLENFVRHFDLLGNRIGSVRNALNSTGRLNNVRIVGNTFFEVTECAGAGSLIEARNVEVTRNLAVDCLRFSDVSSTSGMSFGTNVSNAEVPDQPSVTVIEDLQFVSKDWHDEDFLRPAAHPKLQVTSSGEDPEFIGAVRPGGQD